MRLVLTALLLAGTPLAAAPVDQGAPNVPSFKPAFAGQTRAEEVKTKTPLSVTEITSGLNKPWGLAFLPDGRMLVTEKGAGAIRIVTREGAKSARIAGLPTTDTRGQGGMFDVALSPDYATSGTIFWSYAESRTGGTGLAVARGRLVTGAAPRVENVRVIFRMMPTLDSIQHYGARLVFARDGTLFVTMGERSILPGRVQAQNLKSDLGKIARINPDGSVPKNNPFVGKAGVRPEIWSYGHRNVEGLAFDAKNQLWATEFGEHTWDELNLIVKGHNYGWPNTEGKTSNPEYTSPKVVWATSAAGPSSIAIRNGVAWIGAVTGKRLYRVVLTGTSAGQPTSYFVGAYGRIRSVHVAPDGYLLIGTSNRDGRGNPTSSDDRLLRLSVS